METQCHAVAGCMTSWRDFGMLVIQEFQVKLFPPHPFKFNLKLVGKFQFMQNLIFQRWPIFLRCIILSKKESQVIVQAMSCEVKPLTMPDYKDLFSD
jgi:hypothetical protein